MGCIIVYKKDVGLLVRNYIFWIVLEFIVGYLGSNRLICVYLGSFLV